MVFAFRVPECLDTHFGKNTMRELERNEILGVSGGSQFGCDFVSLSDLGAYAGTGGAVGTTGGIIVEASTASATQFGLIGVGVTVAFIGGYTVGTAISHLVGNCDSKPGNGGS